MRERARILFEFLELLIAGLFLGMTYGLLAIPISLLFVSTDKVDLAVGAYAVLAAAVAANTPGAFGIVCGLLSACAAAGIVGAIFMALDRRAHQDALAAVLASFGFAMFLESFVLTLYGKNPFLRQIFSNFLSFSGIRVSPQAPVNSAIAVALTVALYALLYRTAWGRDMRASAANRHGALLAGIPVPYMQLSAYLIAGLLAGVAGILILYSTGVDFAAGLHLTLAGFGAAILFGLHSPFRGFLGGLSIGVVEALSNGYATGFIAAAAPLVMVFLVLCLGRSSLEQVRGGRA
jgi:branched-subunit amino acid ABC-type transport system permease component